MSGLCAGHTVASPSSVTGSVFMRSFMFLFWDSAWLLRPNIILHEQLNCSIPHCYPYRLQTYGSTVQCTLLDNFNNADVKNHRIINDRMEKSVKGRRFMNNLL